MNFVAEGDKALESKDYAKAITLYTKGLAAHSTSPAYHIKRSTAYLRLRPSDGARPKYQESLVDAELAVLLARQRGKRELMLEAQLRRGIAFYHLERYGDALCALDAVRSVYPKDSKLPKELAPLDVWEVKTKTQISKMGEGDQRTMVVAQTLPEITLPSENELRARYQAEAASDGRKEATNSGTSEAHTENVDSNTTAKASSTNQHQTKPAVPTGPSQNVRHEWYQTIDDVVLTFYVKGVSKEQAQVEFQEKSFNLTINLGPSTDYNFSLDPLYHSIDPEASSYKIMSMKIEVRLKKQMSGQKWSALEGNSGNSYNTPIQPIVEPTATQSAPSYPTSSRKGAKDWDKVAAELARKEREAKAKAKKAEDAKESETKEDDSDSDSEYGSDPVDKFFKKLYANADPDTRRAMMKSYVESGGTALSTNWSEVGQKKVEPHTE